MNESTLTEGVPVPPTERKERPETIGADGKPNDPAQIEAERTVTRALGDDAVPAGATRSVPITPEQSTSPPAPGKTFVAQVADALKVAALLAYSLGRDWLEDLSFSTSASLGEFSGSLSKSQPKAQKPARSWMFAFSDREVEAEKSITLTYYPQAFMKVEKIVSSGDLDDLYIGNALVGQRLQFPISSDENLIPLSTFLAGGGMSEYVFDTCQAALSITLTIVNKSKQSKRFSMVLSGHAVA